MSGQRYLDPIEKQYLGTGGPIVAICRGELDEQVMARAFAHLCKRHPVLRARVREERRGHLLYVSPDCPEVVVRRSGRDFEDVITYVRETSEAWDPALACSKLAILFTEGGAFVVFDIDHGATADGRARNALFGELWQIYTDLVKGIDVPVKHGTLPTSPYELLQRAMEGKQHSLELTNGGLSVDSQLPAGHSPIRRWIRLSRDDTFKLINLAKVNGTSVHGLVSAAILISQRSQGEAPSQPSPMALWSVVDLRKRIGEPVGLTETRDFIGLHKASLTVAGDGDPIQLGCEIKSQLDSAIDSAELFNPVIGRPPAFETTIEQRFANAYVSNLGVVPTLDQPPELTVTNIRIVMPRAGFLPGYGVFTYDGRLAVFLLLSRDDFTEAEADQAIEATSRQLCRAATLRSS